MTRMQRRLRTGCAATFGLVLALGAFVPAAAQDLSIGVVNVSRLLEESPQARQAMEALQEEFAPRQRELVAMQTELREKQETLQRDSAVMGEAERTRLEREVRDTQRNLQRADSEFREDLNIRQNEEVSRVQRELLERVQTYSREEGFDLVIADALYFSDSVDITDEVLETLE